MVSLGFTVVFSGCLVVYASCSWCFVFFWCDFDGICVSLTYTKPLGGAFAGHSLDAEALQSDGMSRQVWQSSGF